LEEREGEEREGEGEGARESESEREITYHLLPYRSPFIQTSSTTGWPLYTLQFSTIYSPTPKAFSETDMERWTSPPPQEKHCNHVGLKQPT
jgi:hypothetical protein